MKKMVKKINNNENGEKTAKQNNFKLKLPHLRSQNSILNFNLIQTFKNIKKKNR